MNAEDADLSLAKVAGAIAERARARMLCCLLDGRARTSTELAIVAEVSPSTASAHLSRLRESQLIQVVAQGKHRYFRITDPNVAAALEALLVVAGLPPPTFSPNTPVKLRVARTCYDHMAGTVAVALHDCMIENGMLLVKGDDMSEYDLTPDGARVLEKLGMDLSLAHKLRRRFACTCLDWSERRPHLGGALGAALLGHMTSHGWIERNLDSRALSITRKGKLQFEKHFNVQI
jgi:DNA-binding transcriptional ArsR family regulator